VNQKTKIRFGVLIVILLFIVGILVWQYEKVVDAKKLETLVNASLVYALQSTKQTGPWSYYTDSSGKRVRVPNMNDASVQEETEANFLWDMNNLSLNSVTYYPMYKVKELNFINSIDTLHVQATVTLQYEVFLGLTSTIQVGKLYDVEMSS
jgi:heme A synthase